MSHPQEVAAVDHAITSRKSARAFTQQAVSRELITDILQVASRAPSGTNTQPWKVYVLQGASRDSLVEKVCAAHEAMRANPELAQQYQEQYDYYPEQWVSPYIDRRRENGWGLYGLLGIGKADKDKMHQQQQRNIKFFDAPVGIVFTIDRRLATGSWLDYGMFLQNVMTAARVRGLDTCAQAAWTHYHKAMRPVLGLDDTETVVCGMALGYADPDAPENAMITERTPAATFARFEGFA